MSSKSGYKRTVKQLLANQFEALAEAHIIFLDSLDELREETDLGENMVESLLVDRIDDIVFDAISDMAQDEGFQMNGDKMMLSLSNRGRALLSLGRILLEQTTEKPEEALDRIKEKMDASLRRQITEIAESQTMEDDEEQMCDDCAAHAHENAN